MSTVALQRFIVRLMFDASLARRLQEQPRQAMKGVALTELEQQWLLASDMRGYRSDPLFAPRLLHAVVGECAVSTGLALAHLRKPSHVLLAFFQSPNAHGAVQHGKSLTLAYADWLIGRVVSGRWAEPRVAQVARLEKCLASLRRPGPRSGGMHPCAELVQTRVNTWAVYNEGLAQLRACGDSTAAALEGRVDLSTLPRLHAGTESVLCQTTARGPKGAARIEVLPEALAALVRRAADGQSREQILAHARRLGAEPGEDQAILGELEKDLIVQLEE